MSHVGALRNGEHARRCVLGRCSACGLVGRHRSRRALRGGARSRAEPAGSRSLRGGGVPEPSGARGAAPTLVTAPTPLAFRGGCGWQQRCQPLPERLGGSSPCPDGGPWAGVKRWPAASQPWSLLLFVLHGMSLLLGAMCPWGSSV